MAQMLCWDVSLNAWRESVEAMDAVGLVALVVDPTKPVRPAASVAGAAVRSARRTPIVAVGAVLITDVVLV